MKLPNAVLPENSALTLDKRAPAAFLVGRKS
jgi:hypothetical protein